MGLNIIYNNVAESKVYYVALLVQAAKRNIDIILVQEPTVLYKESKSIILPEGYILFSPLKNQIVEKLRSLIYIKSGLRIRVLLKRLRYVIGVLVEGIDVYNMYLLLKEKIESKIVRAIIKIQGKKNKIVMGDFNRVFTWN